MPSSHSLKQERNQIVHTHTHLYTVVLVSVWEENEERFLREYVYACVSICVCVFAVKNSKPAQREVNFAYA